jgi:hypothetical protein
LVVFSHGWYSEVSTMLGFSESGSRPTVISNHEQHASEIALAMIVGDAARRGDRGRPAKCDKHARVRTSPSP